MGSVTGGQLLERSTEIAVLDAAVQAVRKGHGGAVVLARTSDRLKIRSETQADAEAESRRAAHRPADRRGHMRSVTIPLTRGLRFVAKGLATAVTVRGQRFSAALHAGVLKLTFRAPVTAASVSITAAGIATTSTLAQQAGHHQLSSEQVTVAATDVDGHATPLWCVVERPG